MPPPRGVDPAGSFFPFLFEKAFAMYEMFRQPKYIIPKENRRLHILQLVIYYSVVFTLMALLVLLAACSSGDGTTGALPDGTGSAVVFTVSDSTTPSATRTAPGTETVEGGTGCASLRDDGFGVFACRTGLHPYVSSVITSDFMWNQRVGYNHGAGVWDYSPVVYWPAPVDGLQPYVTFFAYAPYSAADGSDDNASRCIVDFSLPTEVGDPWLLYQLGGTREAGGADGWQARQVDLLYDLQKDCQRGDAGTPVRVAFSFKHAMACAGDMLTVTCSDALQQALCAASTQAGGIPVTLTVDRLTVDYTLLRKGRLVLNGDSSPNWQAVASEDPTVSRTLSVSPARVVASAVASSCSATDYVLRDQGIFYIPVTSPGNPQWADITVGYTTSLGYRGELSTRVQLTPLATAGGSHDFRIVLPGSLAIQ